MRPFTALVLALVMSGSALGSQEIVIFATKLGLPADVGVKEERPQADFAVLEFKHNKQTILHAYLGNAANPFQKLSTRQKIAGELLKVRASITNGSATKEALWDRGEAAFPRYIHFWYDNLSSSEASIAEKIIMDTIRLNKP
jgi:hypothetical protein